MASGILDPSFGNGGAIVHDIDPSSPGDIPARMAVLSDGKILVAGTRDAYGDNEDFVVTRYHADGSLDTTFGSGGKTVVDFTTRDRLYAMTVTASGQIILGGNLGVSPITGALARLNVDGSLDTTFGTNGKVVFNPGSGEEGIASLAIQSDGKIVAGGVINGYRPMVARFDINGSLDTTFGVNGIAQPLNGTLAIYGEIDIKVQPDNKIVMASAADNPNYRMFVARFEANGALDASFDGDGIAGAAFVVIQSQGIKDLALQSDGKILIVGNRFNVSGNSTADLTVVRFNANGSLDSTFGTGGYFASGWNSVEDEAIGVTVQSDGRIILVGRHNQDSLVVRLTASGSFDTTFGTGGYTVTDLANYNNYLDSFVDVAQQPDGRIIALSDAGRDFGLARYLNTPNYPIPNIGGPYIVGEGGSVALSGTGTDPNQSADTLTYAWDLDADGVFGETGASALHGNEIGRNPTFQVGSLDGPPTWPIKLRVTNTNGDTNTVSGAVAINNVAPSATLNNSGPVNEGSTASVDFTSPFDHSAADTSAAFHYAFDYDNNGVWDLGDGTYAGSGAASSATVPAQYLDDIAPSRTVKARIIDKDGGTRDYTTTIAINAVNDAPSEIQFSSGQTVVEKALTNTLVGLLGTIDADLGAEGDTHQYTLVNSASGRFKIQGNELRVADGSLLDYSANTTHTIRIRTTDSHNVSLERDYVVSVLPREMSYKLDKVEIDLGDAATYQLRQAGNEAWFMDADYALTSTGDYQQNLAGANEKWLRGKTNEFNNTWYFIKPNGELFAWNGNGGFPSGTLLKKLEPIYWVYPQLLHNASSENLAYVLDQFLNLRTDNGNLWENYNGQGERWLLGNGGWFIIHPNGDLYSGSRLLASLDPIYHQEIARLHNALPSQISASILPAQSGNPPKLVIDPVAGYVGDWVIELKATAAAYSAVNRYEFAVTNKVPVVSPITPKTMPTSQDTLSVPLSLTNTDPGETVNFNVQAGSKGYIVDTLYQLQFAGTDYDNSSGLGERWFQGNVNQHQNRWYFIKPSGEFYAWSGSGSQGTLLETLDPVFRRFANLLAQAQAQDLAYELDRWVGLYQDPGGLWQNWTGQNERWLRGAGGEWYYIKPDGKFYQGNGQLLATFDPVYYNDVQRLTSAQPNRVAVTLSGSDVIVNPATGFVGNIWVLIEASDMPFNGTNRRRTSQYFQVTVTA